MKIQCPQCGVKGSLDDAFAGKNVRCPKCRALFTAGQERLPTDDAAVEAIDRTTLRDAVSDRVEKDRQPGVESAGVKPQQHAESATDLGEVEIPAADEREGGTMEPPPASEEPDSADKDSTAEEKMVPPLPRQDTAEDMPDLTLGRLLRRAWDLSRGVKAPIWGGLLITYGVILGLVVVLAALTTATGEGEGGPAGMIVELVSSALSTLFTAGLMFMGVKRATRRKVVWKDVFIGFSFWAQILIAAILKMLLVVVGFMLLILPGIYLLVGYQFTFPLIIDRKLSPWQAMETSRKAVHQVWWKVLGLYFVVGLVCGISAIPFGIGLIWTMPLSVVLYGVVYNALFRTQKTAD